MKRKAFVVILLLVLTCGMLFAAPKGKANSKNGKGTVVQQQTSKNVDKAVSGEKTNSGDDTRDSWKDEYIRTHSGQNLVVLAIKSGYWFFFILGCLVLAMAIFIVRFYQLFIKEKLNVEQFHLKIKGLVKAGNISEAIKSSELVQKTTFGQVYRIGLLAYRDAAKTKSGDSLKEEVQNAFNEAAYQTVPDLEKGLGWFDLFAQSSTYFGLLGTIMGLIQAFGGMGDSGGSGELMGGIEKSMGTTALGLIGAISIQFLKMFLTSRSNRLVNDVDEYSVKVMNVISNQIQDK